MTSGPFDVALFLMANSKGLATSAYCLLHFILFLESNFKPLGEDKARFSGGTALILESYLL